MKFRKKKIASSVCDLFSKNLKFKFIKEKRKNKTENIFNELVYFL